MDQKVLRNLSYGLFVVTANRNGKDNGCICNTVIQAASDPLTVSVSLNKSNLTCEMIQETGKMTVSILSEKADFSVFQHFGFASGRTVDKFADFSACKRVANQTMAITEGTNAYLSLEVISQVDLGSHILFIASVTDAEVLDSTPSVTYAYYFEHIKPKPAQEKKEEGGKTVWKCSICGYEYEGEELPPDYICPLCKHPASDFEKVVK